MAEDGREKAGWKIWSEVSAVAADRAGWRQSVEVLCATWRELVTTEVKVKANKGFGRGETEVSS